MSKLFRVHGRLGPSERPGVRHRIIYILGVRVS